MPSLQWWIKDLLCSTNVQYMYNESKIAMQDKCTCAVCVTHI